MKTRRAFGWKDVLLVVIYQLQARGMTLPCFRCGEAIFDTDVRGKNVEREHIHERELGGADEPDNCRYSHKACHARITNGNGATSAGSSKNRIAKATNPKRIAKFVVNKPPLGGDCPAPDWRPTTGHNETQPVADVATLQAGDVEPPQEDEHRGRSSQIRPRWASQKIPSKPFQKGHRPMRRKPIERSGDIG